jgi:pyruvate/2-oxoglutarate dehydrogenase complex dihydrolipoamide acyltransferase (E2) component
MNGFEIEPRNKLLEFACLHVPAENRPAHTVTFISEVDLTEVEMIRARAATEGRKKPSYTAFVAKAVAKVLREFPLANRRVYRLPFFKPRLQRFHHCDIAVACERDLPGVTQATFVDVLRAADKKDLAEVTAWLHALATCDETNNKQWRDMVWAINRLPSWLSFLAVWLQNIFPTWWVRYRGAAALISSPAKYGVDAVSATWPWPLGISFGLVKPRVVAREGKPVVRPTFQLTLAFDRRVMVGAAAAKVFGRLVEVLESAQSQLYATENVASRVSVAVEQAAVSRRTTKAADERSEK